MNTRLLLFISLLLTLKTLYAQGNFQGQVLDAETEEPIPFATIAIPDTHNGVVADSFGFFEINDHPKATFRIQISAVGFETVLMEINPQNPSKLQIKLKPSHFELNELVLSVPSGKLSDENIVNVERMNLSETKGASSISLAQSLARVSGVDVVSTGQGIGKPVIRGLSGNRIVTYTQGMRLENQQFGDEHGIGENAVGIDRVEVIKGPASLLYGADALGGVLFLVPSTYAPQNTIEGFAATQYQSNSRASLNSGGLKLNKGGVKWNVFGAYHTNADYQIPNSQRVENTRFEEVSFKTSLGYNRKNWVTNLRYSYLKDDFGIPEGTLTKGNDREQLLPLQVINQHLTSWENIYYWNKVELSAILGYSVNDRQEFDESFDDAALHMNLTSMTYNLKGIVPIGKDGSRMMLGVQGMHNENINSGEEILIPDATTVDAGGYAMLDFALSPKWDWQGGVRFDHRNISTISYDNGAKVIPALDKQFESFNFSIGSIYQSQVYSLRFNLASGFRPPNTAELLSEGVHEGTLRYERGNPNLKSESGLQMDISIERKSDHLTIGINPFYNRINNFIVLEPTGDVQDGEDVFGYTQLDAKLYGGELGLHLHPHAIHWLHVESNFSAVYALDVNGDYLPLIPANKLTSRMSVEFSHVDSKPEIGMSVEHLHKFRQGRVAENETTSAAYHTFSMGANFSNKGLNFDVGIDNLFNTHFIDHLSRLKRDGISNPGRNFYIGVKYSF